ncbi:hypothetical protein GXM_09528 [Nostoc sphaeroides CCNUC1]|uniref:Uncharacterized protein n=1 Tax=Nostoc sphaeroides CCNUC1 TaxID=2653204 RepID=A0A5P8WH61_9NOSO|nr:hypothetical protein GXM_09528 [Nostoc sphaeroides CCNUC1]
MHISELELCSFLHHIHSHAIAVLFVINYLNFFVLASLQLGTIAVSMLIRKLLLVWG